MGYTTDLSEGSSNTDRYHGAVVRIYRACDGEILHESKNDTTTTPTIRSHEDGIRVGCSFITNSALDQIYDWHLNFLRSPESKTHQRVK